MKTFTATPHDITHDWHVVDATGVPLGRLASVVAQLIRGKHKPTYTPHMDGGDFVDFGDRSFVVGILTEMFCLGS